MVRKQNRLQMHGLNLNKMKPKTVNEYIALQPLAKREILEEMRSIIHSAVPKAEERISYMIPCYKLNGFLVGFGAHKKGCSFYAMHASIGSVFPKELKDIEHKASTIHFMAGKKIPATLIKKIIKFEAKENQERTKRKSKKS